MNTIKITLAETADELQQILALQQENHVASLSPEEKQANGFVTVKHDLELLKHMNRSAQQVIAKEGDKVVGYALVMLKEHSVRIPVLVPMFDVFNKLMLKGESLSEFRYYVMGQVCIADTHRGQGIFEAMYAKHKEVYSTAFDICLTEVSTSNQRSMKAHQKVGFEILHTFRDATDEWNILVWDWK